jgi:HEPN domain-containing protein
MCHQAIEKVLKASICSLTENDPVYTHSLDRLIRASGLSANIPAIFLKLIDQLEPLNIEARYPTHKTKLMQSLNNQRSQNLLNQTRELFEWIKSKL